jgi:hypothetical protein
VLLTLSNYSRQLLNLLKAIGRVEGLVTSDEEVHNKLMLDRAEWRSNKIKMKVAASKEVDSNKRGENSKIRRIVVI